MDYIFLNGVRVYKSDFYNKIVKIYWFEMGEYGYLGLVFDLENVDCVCFLYYVIDFGIFFGYGCKVKGLVIMVFEKIECFFEICEYVKSENVDFENVESV